MFTFSEGSCAVFIFGDFEVAKPLIAIFLYGLLLFEQPQAKLHDRIAFHYVEVLKGQIFVGNR